jgi:hypothetical protein
VDFPSREVSRVFKTAWFSKAARKANLDDEELCAAIRQVMLGQADDLGGGVYKKRLGKNLYRSIVIARGRRYWVFTYLFAKQDRANIDSDDLAAFRAQAGVYALKSDAAIDRDVDSGEIEEICHGGKPEVQERGNGSDS